MSEIIDVFDHLGPHLYDYREPYRKLYREQNALTPTVSKPCANNIERAAQAIKSADYLLIAAGAGMSVDSGVSISLCFFS